MAKEEFKLAIVDTEQEEVWAVLGMTDERSDEIEELATEAYKNHKLFTDSLAVLIPQMNHINEVVFATLILGRIHDNGRMSALKDRLQAVEGLLELMKYKLK